MEIVKRIYVEKKPEYAISANSLLEEFRTYLNIETLINVRVLIRYDIENIDEEILSIAKNGIFSEPPVDILYEETFPMDYDECAFSVEYLPGQFDQRADSAIQCIQFLKDDAKPLIQTAVTYVLKGNITDKQIESVKNFCINPVDSRETGLEKPETLSTKYEEAPDVAILTGFCELSKEKANELYDSLSLAMTFADFLYIQNYFNTEEKRDPSITEIRVLDTYWSDHCRHTTFSTELTEVNFGEGDYRKPIEDSYNKYLDERQKLYEGRKDKYVCLMDLALLAMKKLKKEGKLNDQEESEEINACSIVVPVTIDGQTQEWLVNFKNETHNHPTEIEPFGGAATCLGGAIRDPLSGRTYVYQAMRVTGAGDPTVPLEETIKGKLPQKKLVKEAAHGYSSYGNQIGLATGLVKEIYHPGYVAKRMEIGAVIAAAPRNAVIRESAAPGDFIILLGGRTGRDGCGGATGSSKAHTKSSIEVCGAEVQKGNPPTERKLQRLFKRPEVSRLIKKCNDFGAGGVSVAIGELADGLKINLDKVPMKYKGLDGTELAISESQERMAVVIAPENVDLFLKYSEEENLEATQVAIVTKEKRLVLFWRGKEIVNISRAFLDTNGAHQEAKVFVEIPSSKDSLFNKTADSDIDTNFREEWLKVLCDLNVCSQKGLVEMFDSSIGAASVLMPYGGKFQTTETQVMAAKLPSDEEDTGVTTLMSYGFDPYLSAFSPYHGAVYAVTESIAKIIAAGGEFDKIRFTFQEYFRRMSEEPSRWSEPFAALLGAFEAQIRYGLPSVGGKDSMSGSFENLDVPPTLVSFAVNVTETGNIISPEFKMAGDYLVRISVPKDEYDLPIYDKVINLYKSVTEDIRNKNIIAAYVLDRNGLLSAVSKMAFGNGFGITLDGELTKEALLKPAFGDIIAEVPFDKIGNLKTEHIVIGSVTDTPLFGYGNTSISFKEAFEKWESPLKKVFPNISGFETNEKWDKKESYNEKTPQVSVIKGVKPKVFIPVFPGTNCEYDSAKAFIRAGAEVKTQVFVNLNSASIRESVKRYEKAINESQIIMFPGGFSAGDEPDGSAKFFAAAFKNPYLKEAVMDLLNKRDGLILGVCNGFQALIKLGLVPYGEIRDQSEDSPTLTFNTIGRHISKMVYTKIVSNKSPWLSKVNINDVIVNPASHGEGRFAASPKWVENLFQNGQVATRYCDPEGNITPDETWNVNGSVYAIEGITSPDGRVFGKMAHVERRGKGVAINIIGEQDMKVFEAGVEYFG